MHRQRQNDRPFQEPSRKGELREPSEIDVARVIHSSAFRRLQSKTQVLGLGESDFYRTRLTHTLEVAQIATGMLRILQRSSSTAHERALPDVPLITTIALAHDIGHPPFGHGGEVALNYLMQPDMGFEGNGQTLRILSNLERRHKGSGLNLTRRSLLGILKYTRPFSQSRKRTLPSDSSNTPLRQVKSKEWKPPKCYLDTEQDTVNWILSAFSEDDKEKIIRFNEIATEDSHGKAKNPTLDCSIMDLADDISYGIHDLEDGIHMGFVTAEIWSEFEEEKLTEHRSWLKNNELTELSRRLFSNRESRKEAIGALVNAFVTHAKITEGRGDSELLRLNVDLDGDESRKVLDKIKGLVVERVIQRPEVQTLEYKGQQIVMELFEAFNAEPKRLLPLDTQEKVCISESKERVICDHISGMTDEYASRIYGQLFMPGQGSVFQKI